MVHQSSSSPNPKAEGYLQVTRERRAKSAETARQPGRACNSQDLTQAYRTKPKQKMLSFNGIEVRRPVLPASRGSNRPRWRDSRHDDVLYSDEHPHQAESR